MNKMDFIAELYFLSTENGGRKSFATSGYRPHLKFDFDERHTSGQQIYINQDCVFPGENVMAQISILSREYFENKLQNGFNFNFYEGPNLIGNGKIIEIINQSLLKK